MYRRPPALPYKPRMSGVKYAVAKGELKQRVCTTGRDVKDVTHYDLKRVPVTNTFTEANSTHFSLCGIASGTSDAQRIGNKVFAKYVEIRGEVENQDTVNDYPHTFRLICYVDKQPGGVENTVGNLLECGYADYTAVYASRNLNYRERFNVLKDVTITLAAPGTSACHVPFHLFIPLNIMTTYMGSTDGISSINSNAIYIAVLSDCWGTEVVWCASCRMRYQDP